MRLPVSRYLPGVLAMVRIKRRSCPVDYRLCNQTVHDKAFLDYKKTENVDKTGSKEVNSFLLVIPCSEVCVYPEDKVLLGAGEEITAAQWTSFIL